MNTRVGSGPLTQGEQVELPGQEKATDNTETHNRGTGG